MSQTTVTLDGIPVSGLSRNVTIRSTSPGGFAGGSFSFKRRLDAERLAPFSEVGVYDSATAEQVGGGRLLEPTPTEDGTWDVSFLGEGPASLQDRRRPYFLADSNGEQWFRNSRTTKRLDVTQSPYPGQSDEDAALTLEMPEGIILAVNDEIVMVNRLPLLCGMRVGSLGFRHKSGISNSNFRVRGVVFNDVGGSVTPIDDGWSTTISARDVMAVGTDWSGDYRRAGIVFKRISTVSPTTTEDYWSAARDMTVTAQILGTDRALLPAPTHDYTRETFRIEEVFIDWLARYCPRLDVENLTYDTGTYEFDQLAWVDGINGVDLMDELISLGEPTFAWHVWDKASNGRWVTELVDTASQTVRYEASPGAGFRAPTPSTEIFDQVTVTGKTPRGRDWNITATSTVESLDDAGIIREDTIPLGTEVWSGSQAAARGSAFLDAHAVPPNAGTIVIAQPVFDTYTGRYVRPSMIRPGYLMRVCGLQASPDTLNATSADGQTVFRLVSMEYSEASGLATCELDSNTFDEDQALVDLYKRSRAR